MERGREDGLDGPNDERVLELIGAAVIAGAYRQAAREMPVCQSGWTKMATRHSERVRALADEIIEDATLALMAGRASSNDVGLSHGG